MAALDSSLLMTDGKSHSLPHNEAVAPSRRGQRMMALLSLRVLSLFYKRLASQNDAVAITAWASEPSLLRMMA